MISQTLELFFYEDSINLEQELKIKIADYLNNQNPQLSDSPVLSALGAKEIAQAKEENNKYEALFDSLWAIVKSCQDSSNAQKMCKKILWIKDHSKNYGLAKHLLREEPVSFDVRYDYEEALNLYKENNYIAVVVDVGAGEEIEEVLSFCRGIWLLGQRAYFIFFGDLATINRYGKQFAQIGTPAVTNNAANVIVLLKDVINGKAK